MQVYALGIIPRIALTSIGGEVVYMFLPNDDYILMINSEQISDKS